MTFISFVVTMVVSFIVIVGYLFIGLMTMVFITEEHPDLGYIESICDSIMFFWPIVIIVALIYEFAHKLYSIFRR